MENAVGGEGRGGHARVDFNQSNKTFQGIPGESSSRSGGGGETPHQQKNRTIRYKTTLCRDRSKKDDFSEIVRNGPRP